MNDTEKKLLLEAIEVNKQAIGCFWHLRKQQKWRDRIKKLINNTRTFIIAVNNNGKNKIA